MNMKFDARGPAALRMRQAQIVDHAVEVAKDPLGQTVVTVLGLDKKLQNVAMLGKSQHRRALMQQEAGHRRRRHRAAATRALHVAAWKIAARWKAD